MHFLGGHFWPKFGGGHKNILVDRDMKYYQAVVSIAIHGNPFTIALLLTHSFFPFLWVHCIGSFEHNWQSIIFVVRLLLIKSSKQCVLLLAYKTLVRVVIKPFHNMMVSLILSMEMYCLQFEGWNRHETELGTIGNQTLHTKRSVLIKWDGIIAHLVLVRSWKVKTCIFTLWCCLES